MEPLSTAGDIASIAGLILSGFALFFAKGAKEAARQARTEIRKGNATEVLSRISDTSSLLQACLENNQDPELIVRARDLISEISRFKSRYERFLDPGSRARLDGAREQVGVLSRAVSTRGISRTPHEKGRMLKICHQEIVAVLNEESARIKAAIEREDE